MLHGNECPTVSKTPNEMFVLHINIFSFKFGGNVLHQGTFVLTVLIYFIVLIFFHIKLLYIYESDTIFSTKSYFPAEIKYNDFIIKLEITYCILQWLVYLPWKTKIPFSSLTF